VGLPLLGGQQGQEGRERIEREGLAGGEAQALARELEEISRPVRAHHRALARLHGDAQIVESEGV
jgi:hypothetical protein